MKKFLFVFGVLLFYGYAAPVMAATTTPLTVEATVREYFADIPVMIEIARCESKFRQFTDSGNVLRGGTGGQMVGVFQFFDRYHTSPADQLGFDIETLEGNLEYARYVYQQQGTTPWNSARNCWDTGQTVEVPTIASSAPTDQELRQQIALLQQLISLLQQLLMLRAQL